MMLSIQSKKIKEDLTAIILPPLKRRYKKKIQRHQIRYKIKISTYLIIKLKFLQISSKTRNKVNSTIYQYLL